MILVEINKKSGQVTGDWIVRNGSGGRIISRHRTKSAAVKRARREARKRGTSFRVQDTQGRWSQGPGYG